MREPYRAKLRVISLTAALSVPRKLDSKRHAQFGARHTTRRLAVCNASCTQHSATKCFG
jgi:hypothetical protein